MTLPAKNNAADPYESALIEGDLSKLSTDNRVRYYNETCKSLGLNPLTQPFGYIILSGKLRLYALRAATDQLRKLHDITVEIVSRDVTDGILTIHVRANTADGRRDEDLGSVPFPETLKGEARANQEMKCVTKAKRRATLSICGLGWLDETEVETIPGAKKEPKAEPDVMDGKPRPTKAGTGGNASADQSTATTTTSAPNAAPTGRTESAAKLTIAQIQAVENEAREAADRGSQVFQVFWRRCGARERAVVQGMGQLLRGRMEEADECIAADRAI